jgi:hypothetical protein
MRKIPRGLFLWASGFLSALLFGFIAQWVDPNLVPEEMSTAYRLSGWEITTTTDGNLDTLRIVDKAGMFLLDIQSDTPGYINRIEIATARTGDIFILSTRQNGTYEAEYTGGELATDLRIYWDFNADGFFDKRIIDGTVSIRLGRAMWISVDRIIDSVAYQGTRQYRYSDKSGWWEAYWPGGRVEDEE